MKMTDFWVFGYGSLMWNPNFDYIISQKARLSGFHRAPCVYSFVHRGTRDNPGVVLGLAPEGACDGLAFKAKGENKNMILDYLRGRELVTNVYKEIEHPIELASGELVSAYTYVVDTEHEQYVRDGAVSSLLPFIRQGSGKSGTTEDYMYETSAKLESLGIDDKIVGEIIKSLKGT